MSPSADVGGLNGEMRPVQEIGDELYALPPQTFTATRDGYVAEAKKSGDRAAAAQLAAMKRPSVAAWLVNLVALRRPDSLAQLIELGETIRDAQGSVTPTQLRDLSAQRRKQIDAITTLAQSLAASLGESAPSKQHLAEVESTLTAAMADEEAARPVRAGRVLKALSYSGFGAGSGAGSAVGLPAAAGTRPGAAAPPSVVDEESRHAAATARLDEARRVLTDATTAERDANDRADRLVAEIAHLRERLDTAQHEARAARQSRLAAERDLASAERRLRSLKG